MLAGASTVVERKDVALAVAARDAGEELPAAYHKLYRVWFAFGFPAFFAVLAIVWLMLTKPAI